MITSCQPSPQPQASGIAAIRASIGTTTKMATRAFSPEPFGSASRSLSGVFGGACAICAAVAPVVSVAVVMDPRLTLRPVDCGLDAPHIPWTGDHAEYAYVTVTYVTVGCTSGKRIFPGGAVY